MTVYVREGLHRATTRGIAEEAGVSEVTLFRHFKTKEGLLEATIMDAIKSHADQGLDETVWEKGLRKGITHFAMNVYTSMVRDEALIRTMIGEAKRHPHHADKIVHEMVRPVREKFILNLEKARGAGQVRHGLNLELAAEPFFAMLLGGMLKNTGNLDPEDIKYTNEQYVDGCVELLMSGISPAQDG